MTGQYWVARACATVAVLEAEEMMILTLPWFLDYSDRYIVAVAAALVVVVVDVAVVAVVAVVVLVLSQWQRNWVEVLESVHLLAGSWEHH